MENILLAPWKYRIFIYCKSKYSKNNERKPDQWEKGFFLLKEEEEEKEVTHTSQLQMYVQYSLFFVTYFMSL